MLLPLRSNPSDLPPHLVSAGGSNTGLYCAMTSSNGSVEASAASTAAAYHGYDSGHSTSHSPNDDALIAASGKAAVISREAADKLGELECTQYGLYGTSCDLKDDIEIVGHFATDFM